MLPCCHLTPVSAVCARKRIVCRRRWCSKSSNVLFRQLCSLTLFFSITCLLTSSHWSCGSQLICLQLQKVRNALRGSERY